MPEKRNLKSMQKYTESEKRRIVEAGLPYWDEDRCRMRSTEWAIDIAKAMYRTPDGIRNHFRDLWNFRPDLFRKAKLQDARKHEEIRQENLVLKVEPTSSIMTLVAGQSRQVDNILSEIQETNRLLGELLSVWQR